MLLAQKRIDTPWFAGTQNSVTISFPSWRTINEKNGKTSCVVGILIHLYIERICLKMMQNRRINDVK